MSQALRASQEHRGKMVLETLECREARGYQEVRDQRDQRDLQECQYGVAMVVEVMGSNLVSLVL